MKQRVNWLILIALFSFSLNIIQGKVTSVADGDTITTLQNQHQIKVRLNGIDCPEKTQAFGSKAKEFTSKACFGEVVRIVSHGKDRYGRIIADVYLPDGRMLNQELVRVGLAWHYKYYSSDTILAALEIEAREKRIGLWQDKEPVAPWEFRRKK